MAQPSVISDVLTNKTFRGRGLTARFLYCMPESSVGNRKYSSKPISNDAYINYDKLIKNMLEDEYTKDPDIITLSKEASILLKEFAEELELKLIKEYAEIADWAGKLIGNTLRIAGLLYRASRYISHDFLDVTEPLIVDKKTMENAILLGRYFLNHAQAVYSVLPENNMCRQAERILAVIKKKHIQEFDRREAMRMCRSFKTAAEIQPVLDFLYDYGYIVQKQEKVFSVGRPTLPKYKVNPWIFDE